MKHLSALPGIVLLALLPLGQKPTNTAVDASADAAKEADIRNLIELTGTRDIIQASASQAIEAYREKLLAALPENSRSEEFADEFMKDYQARFNADQLTDNLVALYDKHFSAEEIKGLLQFYGSPLGQRAAKEMPVIVREAQRASQALNQSVTRDVLQELKGKYPDLAPYARRLLRRPGQPVRNQPASPQ